MTETKEIGVEKHDKTEDRRFLWREEKSPIGPRAKKALRSKKQREVRTEEEQGVFRLMK